MDFCLPARGSLRFSAGGVVAISLSQQEDLVRANEGIQERRKKKVGIAGFEIERSALMSWIFGGKESCPKEQ